MTKPRNAAAQRNFNKTFQDEINKQKAAAAEANGGPGDLLKKGPIDLGKEAAMEAEVRAAKERQVRRLLELHCVAETVSH
jgi:hypothetical protein